MRRAVPLALALLNVSNPDMTVMDTLSRLSHDTGQWEEWGWWGRRGHSFEIGRTAGLMSPRMRRRFCCLLHWPSSYQNLNLAPPPFCRRH